MPFYLPACRPTYCHPTHSPSYPQSIRPTVHPTCSPSYPQAILPTRLLSYLLRATLPTASIKVYSAELQPPALSSETPYLPRSPGNPAAPHSGGVRGSRPLGGQLSSQGLVAACIGGVVERSVVERASLSLFRCLTLFLMPCLGRGASSPAGGAAEILLG